MSYLMSQIQEAKGEFEELVPNHKLVNPIMQMNSTFKLMLEASIEPMYRNVVDPYEKDKRPKILGIPVEIDDTMPKNCIDFRFFKEGVPQFYRQLIRI